MEAITEIRRVAGEKCFVSGLSAVVTDTKALVEEQEGIYVEGDDNAESAKVGE